MPSIKQAQREWDLVREYLGWCPLYEGAMLEKDSKPSAPIHFMQEMTQKNHKCKFCNVNRAGEHQDFCPSRN